MCDVISKESIILIKLFVKGKKIHNASLMVGFIKLKKQRKFSTIRLGHPFWHCCQIHHPAWIFWHIERVSFLNYLSYGESELKLRPLSQNNIIFSMLSYKNK